MSVAIDIDLGIDPRRKNFFCNYCGYETYWSPAFSRHEKECQWKKILDESEDEIVANQTSPPGSHAVSEVIAGNDCAQQKLVEEKRRVPPPAVLSHSIYDVPPAAWEVQLAKFPMEVDNVEDSECTADSSSDLASHNDEKSRKLNWKCSSKHESRFVLSFPIGSSRGSELLPAARRMDFTKMKSVYCIVKKSKKKKNTMFMVCCVHNLLRCFS